MHLTNFHFYNNKNYLYSKPVKSLRGCGVGYRFSFNGQEKDDEVSGAGNTMTAEFWEYDTRLGRRWNLDPVVKEWESGYVAFSNSPIGFVDPDGDDAKPVDNSKIDIDLKSNGDSDKKNKESFESTDRSLWARLKTGIYRVFTSQKTMKNDIDALNNNQKRSWLADFLNITCEDNAKLQSVWLKNNLNKPQKEKSTSNFRWPKIRINIGFRWSNWVIFDININTVDDKLFEEEFPGRVKKSGEYSKKSIQFFYRIKKGTQTHIYQGFFNGHGPHLWLGGKRWFHYCDGGDKCWQDRGR